MDPRTRERDDFAKAPSDFADRTQRFEESYPLSDLDEVSGKTRSDC